MNFDGMQQYRIVCSPTAVFFSSILFLACYWSNRQIACSSHTHSQNSVFPASQLSFSFAFRVYQKFAVRFSLPVFLLIFSLSNKARNIKMVHCLLACGLLWLVALPSKLHSRALCITCILTDSQQQSFRIRNCMKTQFFSHVESHFCQRYAQVLKP